MTSSLDLNSPQSRVLLAEVLSHHFYEVYLSTLGGEPAGKSKGSYSKQTVSLGV
ncbi:MAG: hypothetical protein AAF217_04155 [Pseudomonadota bacterium]